MPSHHHIHYVVHGRCSQRLRWFPEDRSPQDRSDETSYTKSGIYWFREDRSHESGNVTMLGRIFWWTAAHGVVRALPFVIESGLVQTRAQSPVHRNTNTSGFYQLWRGPGKVKWG